MTSHDSVSRVVKSLETHPALSATILEQTRSELRALQFRNPHGTFGRGDNDLRRASALLEYVCREQEGRKLSTTQLAKASFMKEREFTKFHRRLGNFRSKAGTSCNNTSQKMTTESQNSIPALAMKLGSHVADSNGAAIRAKRLLRRLLHANRHKPNQLQDMARFTHVYEAVCFYIAATQDVEDSGEDGKQLTVSTIVDISHNVTLSQFASILEHVQSMIEEIKVVASNEQVQEVPPKDKAPTKKRKIVSRRDDPLTGTTTTKSIRAVSSDKRTKTAQELLQQVQQRVGMLDQSLDDNKSDSMLSDRSSPQPNELSFFSPGFLEWRRQVLSRAMANSDSTKLTVKDDGHKSHPSSCTEVLENAARGILQSYGLLSQ